MTEATPNARQTIKELNDNDVLCGRGPGLSQFEGNLRFHKLVNARKEQYNDFSTNRREKKRLANEILSFIYDKGGRFLKQKNTQGCLDTEWYEVELSISEEKVKQALREKYNAPVPITKSKKKRKEEEALMKAKRPISNASSTFDAKNSSLESAVRVPFSVPSQSAASFSRADDDPRPSLFPPAFSPQLSSIIDPRLLLFQDAVFGLNQQRRTIQTLLMSNPAILSQLTNCFPNRLRLLQDLSGETRMDEAISGVQQQNSINFAAKTSVMDVMTDEDDCCRFQDLRLAGTVTTSMEEDVLNEIRESSMDIQDNTLLTPSEEEVAAFLLSSLAVTGRQGISNEEEAKERATMTDEEKAALFVDTFGKMCKDETPLRRKRPKLDLDPSSIAFLVGRMKRELAGIPIHKKRALLEARSKCSDYEFSDDRLVKFLRCEGMNAQLAAQRFVRYWQSRRDVFGDEKYVLPMTLSGAVRDDMSALLSGVYSLLPHLDSSGRQITYLETRRNTLDGYDSRSLMRAMWYTIEVRASENTHISGGIVQCVWFAGATIWDYDRVYDQMADYFSNCFPIKVLASHLCCPPKVITRVVQPIIHSFMSKEFRARTLTHDVPESDILPVLLAYGITPDMLPIAMGGTVVLDQAEWIATRRAIEMEEL